jgi:Helix-turn-helix domain
MDELWRRLRVFSKHAAAIPAEERGSFEWLSSAGAFWWQARQQAGMSRQDLAQQLGITEHQLCFREFGLVTPRELSERSLRACARALGAPDLYEQFHERFEQ